MGVERWLHDRILWLDDHKPAQIAAKDGGLGCNIHVQVCQNLSCSIMGAETIIDHLERKLTIKVGETTSNKKFTLTRVECLGACGTAPVMQINDDYHEDLTPEKVDSILEGLD